MSARHVHPSDRAVAGPGPLHHRLPTALLSAVVDSGRAVAEVAAGHGVAWWTVQATVNAAALLLPDADELPEQNHARLPANQSYPANPLSHDMVRVHPEMPQLAFHHEFLVGAFAAVTGGSVQEALAHIGEYQAAARSRRRRESRRSCGHLLPTDIG